MDRPLAFMLTEEERLSPLWARLLAHLEQRVANLRIVNESPDRDDRSTQFLRGQIRALRDVISLNTDRPDMTQ